MYEVKSLAIPCAKSIPSQKVFETHHKNFRWKTFKLPNFPIWAESNKLVLRLGGIGGDHYPEADKDRNTAKVFVNNDIGQHSFHQLNYFYEFMEIDVVIL